MFLDTTYPDKQVTRQINESVGPAFSWKIRWKMGGIGSQRLRIYQISEDYQKYLNADHYLSHTNIELRPKGLLLHFRHKLQTYSWLMPFQGLAITKEDQMKLESMGKFIVVEKPTEKFLEKLQTAKAAHLD